VKEAELRKHTTCDLCHQPIGTAGIPLFWRVTFERFGLQLDAIRRQDGLTALLGGNAFLAQHMGTDESLATPIMEPNTITVCERCATEKEYPVAHMALKD